MDPAKIVPGEAEGLVLSGLEILPGLVNAHDHLQFALFPRLGSGPYADATEWAHDIYRPSEDPVRRHLRVPKELRLIWGGLRNLLAGVTTVSHHDPYHPIFDDNFPVRVIRDYGWAHSFAFAPDVQAAFDATPPGAPFIIHLAEGTSRCASQEIFRLHEMGALTDRTVLVHAVGIPQEGWRLVRETGASVVWCPRSNLFTLGRTLDRHPEIPMALATDSPLTTTGDLLDEINFSKDCFRLGQKTLLDLVTQQPAKILHLPERPGDWIATPSLGEAPELVVMDGTIGLISPRLYNRLAAPIRGHFTPIQIEGRPPVLVRHDVPGLLAETRSTLGCADVRLGGRLVTCGS